MKFILSMLSMVRTYALRSDLLPRLVSTLIGIALIGQLTAIGLSSYQHRDTARPAAAGSGDRTIYQSAVNVDVIVSSHLFGVAVPETPIDSELPATRHRLLLSATFAMRDPGRGYAILGESDRSARVFAVGAEIADGSVLQRVYTDRVILNHDGTLERLTLLDRTGAASVQITAPQSERQVRVSAQEPIDAEETAMGWSCPVAMGTPIPTWQVLALLPSPGRPAVSAFTMIMCSRFQVHRRIR